MHHSAVTLVPTNLPATCDTLVIGAGVVGLSLAYELSRRGGQVVVVDRQPPGREASWAGAGILPPGSWYDDHPALAALARVSTPLNARWSQALADQTGIDNQYRITGAIHLAQSDAESDRLTAKFATWSSLDIESRRLTRGELQQHEPALDAATAAAYYVPGEGQVNNRLHLEALAKACKAAGVRLVYPAEVTAVDRTTARIAKVWTSAGSIDAQRVVLAAGAWSGTLAGQLGFTLAVKPLRGQMLNFGPLPTSVLNGNVHSADRYVVPRSDGRLIVGSTVDDVGFNRDTVPAQLAELAAFARRLLPS